MKRTFIQTHIFSRQWDHLGLIDFDLRRLEREIISYPETAIVMSGTGGLHKRRFAYGSLGKSGSARVCYFEIANLEIFFLVTIFCKADKENLSQKERNDIKRMIKEIEREYRKGR